MEPPEHEAFWTGMSYRDKVNRINRVRVQLRAILKRGPQQTPSASSARD